jgi:hypothetical protein
MSFSQQLQQPKSPRMAAAEKSTTNSNEAMTGNDSEAHRSASAMDRVARSAYQKRLALPYLVVPIILSFFAPLTVHAIYMILYELSGGRYTHLAKLTWLWVGAILAIFTVTWTSLRKLIERYSLSDDECTKALQRSCYSTTACVKMLLLVIAFIRCLVHFLFRSPHAALAGQVSFWISAWNVTIPLGFCLCMSLLSVSLVGCARYYGPASVGKLNLTASKQSSKHMGQNISRPTFHCCFLMSCCSIVKCSTCPLLDNPYFSQLPTIFQSWDKVASYRDSLSGAWRRSASGGNKLVIASDKTKQSEKMFSLFQQQSPPTQQQSFSQTVQLSSDGTTITTGPRSTAGSTPFPKKSSRTNETPQDGTSNLRVSDGDFHTLRVPQGLGRPTTDVTTGTFNYENKWPAIQVLVFHLVVHIACGTVFGLSAMRVIFLTMTFGEGIVEEEREKWVENSFSFAGAMCFLCIGCSVLCFTSERDQDEDLLLQIDYSALVPKSSPREINLSQYPKFQYCPGEVNDIWGFVQKDAWNQIQLDLKSKLKKTPLWWRRLVLLLVACSPLIGAWIDMMREYPHHDSGHSWAIAMIARQWSIARFSFWSTLFSSLSSALYTIAVATMALLIFVTGLVYSTIIETFIKIAVSQPISVQSFARLCNSVESRSAVGGTLKDPTFMSLPVDTRVFLQFILESDHYSMQRTGSDEKSVLQLIVENRRGRQQKPTLFMSSVDYELKELQVCELISQALKERVSPLQGAAATSRNITKLLLLESLGGVQNQSLSLHDNKMLPAASGRHRSTIAQLLESVDEGVAVVRCQIAVVNSMVADMEGMAQVSPNAGKNVSHLSLSPGQAFEVEMCLRGATRMVATALQKPSGRHSQLSLTTLPLVKAAYRLHCAVVKLVEHSSRRYDNKSSAQGRYRGRGTALTVQHVLPARRMQQLTASKASRVICAIADNDSTGYYHKLCTVELERMQDPYIILSSPIVLYRLLVVADEAAHLVFSRLSSADHASKNRVWRHLDAGCQTWLQSLLDAL